LPDPVLGSETGSVFFLDAVGGLGQTTKLGDFFHGSATEQIIQATAGFSLNRRLMPSAGT